MTAIPEGNRTRLDIPIYPKGSSATADPDLDSVGGEGAAALPTESTTHGTHAGIKRHRRAGEPLCDRCKDQQREYNREYARLRSEIATYRARKLAAKRERDRRIYSDPQQVASLNARRRQRHREQKVAAQRDRTHGVDRVVVERLVGGEPAQPNRPERLEAVRRLHARGHSYDDIATRLGVHPRQVHRDLADLGLTAHEQRGDVA